MLRRVAGVLYYYDGFCPLHNAAVQKHEQSLQGLFAVATARAVKRLLGNIKYIDIAVVW